MQLNEVFVALGVPLGAFFMSVAIVALVSYFNGQELKLRHETIRQALEKGQPLPPDLFPPKKPRNDIASGIQLLFAGAGISLFLWIFKPERGLWAVGLIIVFVGLGRLVGHAVAGRKAAASPGGPTA